MSSGTVVQYVYACKFELSLHSFYLHYCSEGRRHLSLQFIWHYTIISLLWNYSLLHNKI